MMKATGTMNGRPVLMIGLSFGNLDRFRAAPLDSFIKINGNEVGMPFDVLVFAGESEAQMADMMMKNIGPNTIVHVDKKLQQ